MFDCQMRIATRVMTELTVESIDLELLLGERSESFNDGGERLNSVGSIKVVYTTSHVVNLIALVAAVLRMWVSLSEEPR